MRMLRPRGLTRCRAAAIVFLCAGAAAACDDDDATADARKIAYISCTLVEAPDGKECANDQHVYVINADGSNRTRITDAASSSIEHPTWAPDGTRLAFSATDNGNSEIFVVQADGSGVRNVTNTPDVEEYAPEWSPDGRLILFSSHGRDGAGLSIMRPDGSGRVQLLVNGDRPRWSPDGTHIAFLSRPETDDSVRIPWAQLFVMDDDGGAVTQLTAFEPVDRSDGGVMTFSWSPDGQSLAFTLERDPLLIDVRFPLKVTYSLYTIGWDGYGMRRLRSGDAPVALFWSGDGSEVFWGSERVRADGSGSAGVWNPPELEGLPSFEPGGTRIAFQASTGQTSKLWMVDAHGDGSDARRITHSGDDVAEYAPVWSPDPSHTIPAPVVRVAKPTRTPLPTPTLLPGANETGLYPPGPHFPAPGALIGDVIITLNFRWGDVIGAGRYAVEVDCFGCCGVADHWCGELGSPWLIIESLRGSSYIDHLQGHVWTGGANPARWRVWALTPDGREGPKSRWNEFRYTEAR